MLLMLMIFTVLLCYSSCSEKYCYASFTMLLKQLLKTVSVCSSNEISII